MSVRIDGSNFVDEHDRTLHFRGINLGSNSKMPSKPCGYTWRRNLPNFFDHKRISFVNRPFPLSECDEHYGRLQKWGYTLLRFVITWEAVEHEGPGLYDQEYLDYLYAMVQKAKDYGFWIWIDPHQDVWSRFTGGSGAPGWTLEAVGFDIEKLEASGSAIVHQTHGDPFIHMVWPTNYTKLACSTMFMVFFAGDELAPKTRIAGETAQAYLQRHYINAICQVARKLKDLPHVIGYGAMNEPNMAWIGLDDLHAYKWALQLGPCCTPFQSLSLGNGLPVSVNHYDHGLLGFKNTGSHVLNPKGVRAYKEGMPCVWEANGVIEVKDGKATLLRPRHFAEGQDGRKLHFYNDFFVPFAKRFADAIHDVSPEAMIFVEDAPFAPPGAPHMEWEAEDAAARKIVCADHWYDGISLLMKKYRGWLAYDGERVQLGYKNAQWGREKGIRDIQHKAKAYLGDRPWVVGETGIPLDMYDRQAYRTGEFRQQELAMDRVLAALEVCMASSTIWNYTTDNCNVRGDNWNGEDLSIFSRDQQKGNGKLDDGGRAVVAAVRPHVRAYVGTAVAQTFDMDTKEFLFRFSTAEAKPARAANVFFVPRLHYSDAYEYSVSDGKVILDLDKQLLMWVHDEAVQQHELRIWSPAVRRALRMRQMVIVGCVLMLLPLILFIWHRAL